MGLDEAKQQAVLKVIIQSTFKVIGYAGKGLYTLITAIGKTFSGKEDPLITGLRNEVNNALTLYVETDLKATRNSLTATAARSIRSRGLLLQYKELMNKTLDDIEQELHKK